MLQRYAGPLSHRLLPWRTLARYGTVTFLITLLVSTMVFFRHDARDLLQKQAADYLDDVLTKQPESHEHPIEKLIADAHRKHEELFGQNPRDVRGAARAYRRRRGRHPPPGFDRWVERAMESESFIVESFFDRIYHDLTPFWALDPVETARRAATWPHVVRVRNGSAEGLGDVTDRVAWLALWTALVAEAAEYLPDVDMPINYMDESRLLVPWEDVDRYVRTERDGRSTSPVKQTETQYKGLREMDAAIGEDREAAGYQPEWFHDAPHLWEVARWTCGPDTPGRFVPAVEDFSGPPDFPGNWRPGYAYQGFVQNFTAAMDPCMQPHLRGMHGTFIEGVSASSSRELIPLFGGSKLPMNNEILIPGAMYLTEDPFYSGGSDHGPPWPCKQMGIVWRGVASGGRHKAENWRGFQRQRLVEMLNGTTVRAIEEGRGEAMTFRMAPEAMYPFARRREGKMGAFLEDVADAGFVDLLCWPPDEGACPYAAPYFKVVESIPMVEQYVNKFIPDVDGNSFSARFRGLLLSTSLPLKSTIYAEWHDDRLVPWLHFVPFDNTFQDLHAVIDYFTRDERGDAGARVLAEAGQAWGAQALRREDMLLYVWRLLLEFARVCDENRDRLGYVDDLRTGS